ncbi:hypothetical protein ACFU6I_30395 [Streptomyces sp. NPDC057486]|uniref:hypothetical protein n=1 Tax=Streptomyces sp. NPDC057486 TaxID=3346145 RepID=UPI0036A4E62A
MRTPRPGIDLPAFGPHAGPEAVDTVASTAEGLGFHGVSVAERICARQARYRPRPGAAANLVPEAQGCELLSVC